MKLALIDKLELFRLVNKISQERLAEMLDVRFVTVNRWLNGHTKPNRIHAFHIEKLLSSKRRKK